jgi:selenocysteine lyase/cysteine desulfurase
MLWIRPGLESRIDPYRQGGTGSRSELDIQPHVLPDKYEAGSHNAPGIVALGAAVEWLLEETVQKLRAHEVEVAGRMLEGLTRLGSYRLLGVSPATQRVGIFSVVHQSIDCHTLATVLEDQFDILARAGLHCAPRTHAACGTGLTGALRLSFSAFTTPSDVDRTLAALAEIDRLAH